MENKEYPTPVFQERIESIKNDFKNLCNDTLQLHKKASSLILDFNEEIADSISMESKKIDIRAYELERNCIRFIAMIQPLAGDLMFIESSIRVISHVKRIAYLCNNIAESAAVINGVELKGDIIENLEYMSDYVQIILNKGFMAYCSQDMDVAGELATDDDKIDDMFDIVLSKATKLLTGKTENALEIVNIIFIARYLERIADRVVDIGERIVFINTQKRPHIEELKKEEQ